MQVCVTPEPGSEPPATLSPYHSLWCVISYPITFQSLV